MLTASARADELMDDRDFLMKVAGNNILESYDDEIANSIVALIACVIDLYRVPRSKLLNSGLLNRLYDYAKQYHPLAVEASLDQAEYEFGALEHDPLP